MTNTLEQLAVPLCVNCAHYRKHYDGYDAWDACDRPLSSERSPVDGSILRRVGRGCEGERRDGKTLFGRVRCGRAGQFFARPAMKTAK